MDYDSSTMMRIESGMNSWGVNKIGRVKKETIVENTAKYQGCIENGSRDRISVIIYTRYGVEVLGRKPAPNLKPE